VPSLAERLEALVGQYDKDDNLGLFLDGVRGLAKSAPLDELVSVSQPYVDRHEVMIPIFEHVTSQRPNDAKALVALANAYWLTGRGPDVVGEIAERAKKSDSKNRAAWHLWALSESDVRKRVARWESVSQEFPEDQLARAALADNAASLAGAEHDPLALDLAVKTYEGLWAQASTPTQRRAVEETLEKLKGWKL
jgi:hypothetical protein